MLKGRHFPLHLTVAICTWNRADLLRRTLDQMRHLEIPPGISWELLVVDNNCTDHTDAILEEYRSLLPLRRVFERKPGLSNARNAGIAAASGSFIVWTDDDVLVGREWLAAYARAIHNHLEADVLGGPVEPWFEGQPPRWLARGFAVVADAYAARDPGPEEKPMTITDLPFGANMAVRRGVQRHHLYDSALGRSQGTMLSSEESVVLKRILTEGGHGWWVPEARVRHFVPKSRQNLTYLWRCWHGNGLSAAYVSPSRGRFRVLGNPGWLWWKAVVSFGRLIMSRISYPPDRWLADMQVAAIHWGRLQGGWLGSDDNLIARKPNAR